MSPIARTAWNCIPLNKVGAAILDVDVFLNITSNVKMAFLNVHSFRRLILLICLVLVLVFGVWCMVVMLASEFVFMFVLVLVFGAGGGGDR
jgi:hypothetical protein